MRAWTSGSSEGATPVMALTCPLFTGRNNTMAAQAIQQPQNHQVVMNAFVAACQADERGVAAFFRGSYASGWTSGYSQPHFFLNTTAPPESSFFAGRRALLHLLAERVIREDL